VHKEPEFADVIGAGLFLVDDLVDDITLPMLRYAYVRIRSVKHVLSPFILYRIHAKSHDRLTGWKASGCEMS